MCPAICGLSEVVGTDQVGGERRGEGVGDVLHVLALDRLQHLGEHLGAKVELLVEGVDLRFAMDLVAVPLALRAAAPQPPVGAILALLPTGGLDQRRAAPGADVEPGGGLCLAGACVSHGSRLSEPIKSRVNPHFSAELSGKPKVQVSQLPISPRSD